MFKNGKYILLFNSFYSFIIISNLFISINTYIVLPFKIHSPKNYDNITKVFNELLYNKLIITLQMGNPRKNIDFYASMNEYIYYLEEGSCNKYSTSLSTYDYNKSKTFIETKSKFFCGVKLDECHLGSDYIYLYDNINLNIKRELNLTFYYGNNKENIDKNGRTICGKLGFKIGKSFFKLYEYENFITILRNNKLINSYSWYVHYFDDKKNNFDGAIIFDIFNSRFFKDFPFLKKEDDYNSISVKDTEGILAWTFEFDKIYYISDDTIIDIQIVNSGLAFETNFIHCPEMYFESIKNSFFNSLFENNICHLIEEQYNYIYCDKQSFSKYKNKFPSLIFKSLGLNKTYILNSDDLFKDCGNYFLFMIIHQKNGHKIWTLGRLFMKKSEFYFDGHKKIIGYFNTINIKTENKKKFNFFDKIKWYLLIVVGIVIGIFIGKRIREKTRKLRANELEDNYEYLENNLNGNNDNNKDVKNKSNSNYNEIKTQLYSINE